MLEKTLESPLVCKEIQPVHAKANQSQIFIGRTDAETETPVLRPPDAKNWLIRKDPVAEKDRRQEEKGMTDDEMAGWHHQLDGHELSKLWRLVIDREALHAVVFGVTRIWTQLSDCTELNMHACAHTHTHTHVYIYTYLCLYMCIRIYICTYTHI